MTCEMRKDRADLLACLTVRSQRANRGIRVVRKDAQQLGAGVTGRAEDADPCLVRARSHEPLLSSTHGSLKKKGRPAGRPFIRERADACGISASRTGSYVGLSRG